jgi:CDP-diacylglycerol--glycerol-3-phosphate 3-phosphatidyltransferase
VTRVGDQSLVSRATRDRVRGFATPVAAYLGRLGLTPNTLTVLGFAGMAVAAAAAAFHAWLAAGVLVLVFGVFDMFDGALARATSRVTRFGGFLDSTLDRTGENLVLGGIAFGCAVQQFPLGVLAATGAMAFGSIVTYARARAEAVGVHGEVGIAPRPERLLVMAVGLLLAGWPGGTLWLGSGWIALSLLLITAASAITVLQRIIHVRSQLDEARLSDQPQPDEPKEK